MNETYNSQESNTSMYYNGNSTQTTGNNTQPNNTNGNPSTEAASPTAINNHSINDIYLVLQLLQGQFNKFQNIHFRELLLKVNYLQDSLEHVKQLVQDLNQQMIYAVQNNNNNNGNNNNMMSSNNYMLNNQFKAFEVFTKHLNKLNKEIEEISSGTPVQQSPTTHHHHQQQQQRLPHNVSNQPPRQIQQQPSLSQQQSQIPQQPQSSLPPLPAQQLPSQVNQFGSTHLSVPSTNHGSSQFDEEVDNMARKNLSLRTTASTSPNPTSHYVFDVGPFGSRNMNGNTSNHSLYDKPPIPPDQQQPPQQQPPSDQLQEPTRKKRKPSRKSVSQDAFRNHTAESIQQNARQSPQQQQQSSTQRQQQQQLQQQQQQQQQQVRNTGNTLSFGNTYILPMPPSTSGGNEATSQFILPRDANGTVMTSALRQTSNQTRSSTSQPGTSVSTTGSTAAATAAFPFDDEIESIEGLDNDGLTNGSTTSNGGGTTIDGSNKKSKHKADDQQNKVILTALDVPQYKLERSLKALSDIWKEYAHGMNNKPPLKSLENKYGTKWRNETESRTFLRRKKIYEAIENGMSKGYTEDQVIEELEEHRTYRKNGSVKRKPLLWLSTNMPEKFSTPN